MGIELSKNRQTKEPAREEAAYIVESLRNRNIIISRDGMEENVLKFKPPMCITKADIDFLITELDNVLSEKKFLNGYLKRPLPDNTEVVPGPEEKKQKT